MSQDNWLHESSKLNWNKDLLNEKHNNLLNQTLFKTKVKRKLKFLIKQFQSLTNKATNR